MKKLLAIITIATGVVLLNACSENKPAANEENKETKLYDPNAAKADEDKKMAHEAKGIGKFKDVAIPATLDKPMADAGNKVYDVKCSSCHKLTDEKLVGPGWKEVTSRRKAEWIMNFSTNTDEMLNSDPSAMSMLEECLVRMPNQSLSDDDARAVYEFMRKNDGVK